MKYELASALLALPLALFSCAAGAASIVDLTKGEGVLLRDVGGVLVKKTEKSGGYQEIFKLDVPMTFKGCDSPLAGETVKSIVLDVKDVKFNTHLVADLSFMCWERYRIAKVDVSNVRYVPGGSSK